jgi:hypothetical protein
MTSREVLDTVEQLGYGYDDDPPPAARPVRPAAPPKRLAATPASGRRVLGSTQPMWLTGRPVRAAGDLASEAAEVAAAVGVAEAVAPHLNLNLEGVDRDPDSALLFEVYLNLPTEAPPDPRSPYYVAHFAFFGHMAHGHAHRKKKRKRGPAGARGPRAPREHLHLQHHQPRRPAAGPPHLVRHGLCSHGGPRRAPWATGPGLGCRRRGGGDA